MNLSLARFPEFFAALGEPLRLRLACCMTAVEGGLCVCELMDALQVSQPNVSRHLKLLKAAGLVEEQREGRWVYMQLKHAKHPLFEQIRCCLETVCCCTDVRADLRRLEARLKLRQGGNGLLLHRRPGRSQAARGEAEAASGRQVCGRSSIQKTACE